MGTFGIRDIGRTFITLDWDEVPGARKYRVYWADRNHAGTKFRLMAEVPAEEPRTYTLARATDMPQYVKIAAVTETDTGARGEDSGNAGYKEKTADIAFKKTNSHTRRDEVENAVDSETALLVRAPYGTGDTLETPVTFVRSPQLEALDRGLVAVCADGGVAMSWRLLLSDVTGYDTAAQGLSGAAFAVFKNGKKAAVVTDSTSWFDPDGTQVDAYQVARLACETDGSTADISAPVHPSPLPYLTLPLQKPADGVTPAGEHYTYSANDMSVADIDGDGAYEFFVKWDPSNSHDVSIKGYTGKAYIDCYKLDGRLLWRLDMGVNIRAGAHYTQFICYDFDGDGKAEMAVKTAPGTRMTIYAPDGSVQCEQYITMPAEDAERGYAHTDNYVCSAADYRAHLAQRFMHWQEEPEVKAGNWPDTLEVCFGIEKTYEYPLNQKDAEALTDYFLDVYAPSRSARNELRKFEGFIYEGPEYLTMFAGDGRELSTIPFPFPREDDGLRWGDYALPRIEPCNRSDRFLSGAAYLDGLHPSLIICRGYYTRTCIAAYDFRDRTFIQRFAIDSGHVPMANPFNYNSHIHAGRNTVYGRLAGQGNHSLSAADIDGDGCMELIYGGAAIDHDGSLLYSAYDKLPDGRVAKLGHGDAMHVADIDPDRPGKEIFNVFEGAKEAPYGYALRDAESGKVLFGAYAEEDLGRCMVGDVRPEKRGLSCWVNGVGEYDCKGNRISDETLGSNMSIRYAEDYSTQITDGAAYLKEKGRGVVNDWTHGVMLAPEGTATNNGTKGNPCLVADIFGDYREELLLRTEDSSAVRIYTAAEPSHHKMMTLMHDPQYRCGVAWQNNCYNQPVYPSFYYASDLRADEILPYMKRKPVLYLAGDSISQSYTEEKRPQAGWGEYLLEELMQCEQYTHKNVSISQKFHRADCPFEQERRYESRALVVDNCAMGGRSSRSFREEGRLSDIEQQLRPGDYLLVQFGHNDASPKPERFVAPEEFAASLAHYLDAAARAGARPVLLTPVTLCIQTVPFSAEAEQVRTALWAYAAEMKKFAAARGVLCIDMFSRTEQLCRSLGEEETRTLYIADGVHLTEKGARLYAGIAAEELHRELFAD